MPPRTPLEDPAYTAVHQPINGCVPDVVALWGPRSQLRWFRRFGNQLGVRKDWDRFYCTSEHHRGLCCNSCLDEYLDDTGVMQDGWCCCQDQRMKRVSG